MDELVLLHLASTVDQLRAANSPDLEVAVAEATEATLTAAMAAATAVGMEEADMAEVDTELQLRCEAVTPGVEGDHLIRTANADPHATTRPTEGNQVAAQDPEAQSLTTATEVLLRDDPLLPVVTAMIAMAAVAEAPETTRLEHPATVHLGLVADLRALRVHLAADPEQAGDMVIFHPLVAATMTLLRADIDLLEPGSVLPPTPRKRIDFASRSLSNVRSLVQSCDFPNQPSNVIL